MSVHRPGATTAASQPGAWTFFRQWLKNPRAIAALSPSGRQLTRQMIAQLPHGARRVIELGGGTGVFTRALLQFGIAPDDLMVVELNDELARFLRQNFPDARVVNGDACNLTEIVADSSFGGSHGVDAVVSGLGFLAMSRPLQRSILRGVFSVLAPECPLIQFTYGPANPLPRDLLSEMGLSVRRAGIAWINMPPATIYVYTRDRSTRVHAVRTGG